MGGHGTGIRYSDIALNPLNSLNQISLSVVAIPYAPCHLVQKKLRIITFYAKKIQIQAVLWVPVPYS